MPQIGQKLVDRTLLSDFCLRRCVSLVTLHSGLSFKSISLMDLKLSQFLFIKDLTGNSETAKKSCLKFFQYLGTGKIKRH